MASMFQLNKKYIHNNNTGTKIVKMLYCKFNKSYFVNVPREFHPLHGRIPHAEASHVIGTAIKKNETPQ